MRLATVLLVSGTLLAGCEVNLNTQGLTAQEKALSFMFFDIASCVGSIF
jgi:hypothetical protein